MSTLEMILWLSFAVFVFALLIAALFAMAGTRARCSEQDDLYDRLNAEEFDRRMAAQETPR